MLKSIDSDCPRISEDSGIGLPMIVPGDEIPQLLLDLRMSNSIVWPKINFIHDDSHGKTKICSYLIYFLF